MRNRSIKKPTFFDYLERRISQLNDYGKTRTAETYRTALNKLKEFRKGLDFTFEKLDCCMMEKYQSFLFSQGLIPNSISFHMRILRAAFNRAVQEGVCRPQNPFRYVYTGVDKTKKRSLSIESIKALKTLDLESDRNLSFARDMFLLSFYFRGMSFIDMAFLRKSDLKNGTLTYFRRKTGKRLIIRWTDEMQEIIDTYTCDSTPYLLPIIKGGSRNPYTEYRKMQYTVNRQLKKIGVHLGLPITLTAYVARHSWATIAREIGIPMSTISESLGHESENTTRIYLSLIDTSAVDLANSRIIESLGSPIPL